MKIQDLKRDGETKKEKTEEVPKERNANLKAIVH